MEAIVFSVMEHGFEMVDFIIVGLIEEQTSNKESTKQYRNLIRQ